MPLFEVFIPTTDPDGFNITARIRADSWIQALRNGLAKLGDSADVRNIMCDIKEDGIDVTEPVSGRVFKIRELEEEGAPAAPAAAAPAAAPQVAAPTAAPPIAHTPPPAAAAPPAAAPPAAAPPAAAPPAAAPPVAAPPAAAPPAKREAPSKPPPAAEVMRAPLITAVDRFQPVEEEIVAQEKATHVPPVAIGRGYEETRSAEDLIADLFDATQSIYDHGDLTSAAGFILDLAMQTIPSDSGAVFISDINRNDLYFAAARGPKADEVMSFRVPMGQGIVGFSAQSGVSLAVSDVHKDPRFYATISKALGYETRSILCAPAQLSGRVFGAIELINKRSGSSYTGDEVNILNYLAHEFADYLTTTGQTGD